MNDFPDSKMDNMGGMAAFRFCEYSQMPDFIIPPSGILSTDPEITGNWLNGNSDETLKLTIEPKDNEQGSPYNIALEGVRSVSDELLTLFAKMKPRRFVVLATDADQINYLCGNKDEHLRFTFTIDTGAANGIKTANYKFEGEMSHHPPLVENPTLLQGSGSAVSTSNPSQQD